VAVEGRDGDRLADPERVELDRVVAALLALGLVNAENDRLPAGAQQIGHALVGGDQAIAPIDQEDDHIRLADRQLGLLARAAPDRGDVERSISSSDCRPPVSTKSKVRPFQSVIP
jgi:hypothetical protein